jgi:hypothetical protein
LEGNIFFPDTGIPILKRARKIVVFAVALPDPLMVLNVIQKSFTIDPDRLADPVSIEGTVFDISSPRMKDRER